LTQAELAHQAGIHRVYLSDVEAGKRNLGLDNLCALADALEVDPRELLRPQSEWEPDDG
jgi:transcriptional regulator with XRE-family HTH domain